LLALEIETQTLPRMDQPSTIQLYN